ncbi:ABC transporter ATP-binding protein [Paenibacillus soyae]|uniref:ABC transporter ATP-binding protein n=1 Tax=Paenibacillus soyae TaxID=2969249 RepID=A0A9X2MNA2_9BACL|nr:ABC transporter ATP-binding protein [Paenibacillus soyae]MCR2803440.1 ABC transporter ATP-binding protein [Paenibacillus soyae]
MDMPAIIQLDTVSKLYGANNAIKQLSFQVRQGELFGIMGMNGAGKSTLLELLSCNLQPDGGVLRLLGHDAVLEADQLKGSMNKIPQGASLVERMTVREALETFQSAYSREHEIDTYLSRFGLLPYSDKLIRGLTGGLKQMTMLAIAIAHEPKLIFLDEPTTGLDAQAKRDYWAILAALRAEGKTIVIASHDMSLMQARCDRILVLRKGRMAACDSPGRLIEGLPGGGLTMEAVYMQYAVGEPGGVGV